MKKHNKYGYFKIEKPHEYWYFKIEEAYGYGYIILKNFDKNMKTRHNFQI